VYLLSATSLNTVLDFVPCLRLYGATLVALYKKLKQNCVIAKNEKQMSLWPARSDIFSDLQHTHLGFAYGCCNRLTF